MLVLEQADVKKLAPSHLLFAVAAYNRDGCHCRAATVVAITVATEWGN